MSKQPARKRPNRATLEAERARVTQIVTANPALAERPVEVCRLAGISERRKGTVHGWIKSMQLDPTEVQVARLEGAARVQEAAADALVSLLGNLQSAGNRLASSGKPAEAVHGLAGAIVHVGKILAPPAEPQREQPTPTIVNQVMAQAAPTQPEAESVNPLRGRLNDRAGTGPAYRAPSSPGTN